MHSDDKGLFVGIGAIVVFIIGFILILMFGLPLYNVWSKGLNGQAILKEAEYTRQVRVSEAKARLEASELDAQSVVKRAEGQKKANDLLKDSLSPEILQNKYIEMLEEQGQEGDRTVIYIPTNPDTGLPVSLPAPESTRIAK